MNYADVLRASLRVLVGKEHVAKRKKSLSSLRGYFQPRVTFLIGGSRVASQNTGFVSSFPLVDSLMVKTGTSKTAGPVYD